MTNMVMLFIVAAAGSFLGSYLRKKGENFATKEDVAEITKKIEEVRSQYSIQLETLKASLELSNQLKIAAFEQRIKKHQEAHTLWLQLKSKDPDAIGKCQKWWEENSLYLEAEASKAFRDAYMLTPNPSDLSKMSAEDLRERRKVVEAAGGKITRAMSSLSLGYDETKKTP